jgi:hypothetical protein
LSIVKVYRLKTVKAVPMVEASVIEAYQTHPVTNVLSENVINAYASYSWRLIYCPESEGEEQPLTDSNMHDVVINECYQLAIVLPNTNEMWFTLPTNCKCTCTSLSRQDQQKIQSEMLVDWSKRYMHPNEINSLRHPYL